MMTNATECRAKAAATLVFSATLSDDYFKRRFDAVAADWTAMAATAQRQEDVEAEFVY
jgi:hypothetical protein